MNNPFEICLVIPAYNEHQIIRTVITDLIPYQFALIVIDDGSAIPLSGTLRGLPVYLLRHRINLGQGAALQTGIRFALAKKASYIITFDADGQHHAGDIENMLKPLLANRADITLGSRFLEGSSQNLPAKRKSLLKFARLVNYFFTGLLLTDAHNGLRAMNRKAAMAIRITENGMAHATEFLTIIRKQKLRYEEIPVNITYTDYSKRKGQTIRSSFRIFFDLLLNKIFG